MEDESLSEKQKFSQRNSFSENKYGKNTKLIRFSKRLNTITFSSNLTEKNFNIRSSKLSPKSRNSDRKKTIYSTLNNYNNQRIK